MPLLFLCVMGGYLHFTKKAGEAQPFKATFPPPSHTSHSIYRKHLTVQMVHGTGSDGVNL